MDSRLQNAIQEVNGNLPPYRSLLDQAIERMEPIDRCFYSSPEVREIINRAGRFASDMYIHGEKRFTFWMGEYHPADSEALPAHMRTPANAKPNPLYVTFLASAPDVERQAQHNT